MAGQRKLRETPNKFLIKIRSDLAGTVWAPLPDNFGMTVGSEFSAPFDAHFVSGTVAKAVTLSNIGIKTGVATTKFYSNPEPSEISFELQFEAYHSAREDVLVPVIRLMAMSLGRAIKAEDVERMIKRFAGRIGDFIGIDDLGAGLTTSEENKQTTDRILGFINFVEGPPTVFIKFGEVLKLRNAYISSVAPQFSNILDAQGMPMSATCNVTAIMENDPVLSEESFGDFWPAGTPSGIGGL